MKFVKVLKAAQDEKYVIFENIVSENRSGYWGKRGELVDLQDADIYTNIELAKQNIKDIINIHKDYGETAEHYYAIRPVVFKDLNAVYSTYLNGTK